MGTTRKKMWVEHDDGSDLTKSQKRPGKSSPLTREAGTNKLGQVVLSDIDEGDEEGQGHVYIVDAPPPRPLLTEEEKARIAAALIERAIRARPHVQRWLVERAVPAVRSAWGRWRSGERGRKEVRAGQTSPPVLAAAADEALEPDAAIQERRPEMSAEETRRRFLTALLHRLYSEEQLRMIRETQIEDDADLQELDGMLDQLDHLTVRQLRSAIKQVLEADPSLAGSVPAELESVLGPSRPDDRVLESRERPAEPS